MPFFIIISLSIFAGFLYSKLIKKISIIIEEKKSANLTTLVALPLLCLSALYLAFSFSPQFAFAATLTLLLIPIFLTDALFYLIPDALTIPAIGAILVFQIVRGADLKNLAIAALIAGGFFLFQHIVSSGRWIGSGDIRLGILMGVSLGIAKTLVALFIAYVGGALIALLLIAFKQKELSSKIPFGVFLAVATFVSLVFGDQISNTYLHFLGY
jgi:prepilin signal peptidase PulO-like enzyme (type II secretory pathway)